MENFDALRWLGHVAQMPRDKLPRRLLTAWVYMLKGIETEFKPGKRRLDDHEPLHVSARLAVSRNLRGAPLLFLLVHLLDSSLGRDLLDARASGLPRVALAEHGQRQVVRRAHSESFQSIGGSTEAGEAGEVAVLVGSGELAHEGHDSGALAAIDGVVKRKLVVVVLGQQGWRVVTDQERGGGGIGVHRGRAVQRKDEVNVGDVQDVTFLGVQLGQIELASSWLSSTSTGA